MLSFKMRTGPAMLLVTILCSTVAAWAQKKYVGSEACAQCHADHAEWMKSSAHGKGAVDRKDQKGVTGCESCHGPGSEHAEQLTPGTIFAFKDEPAGERSAACLACHGSRHPELNFRRSDHDRKKVACDDCHTATGSEGFHRMRAVEDVMSRAEPDLCYRCHATQRAAFALPYHHPVRENFMGCSSCHQPHGAFTVRQMRSRHAEAVCSTCHEDQAGPFIFEHPPGRAAGCQSCHQPHGSTNAKMLTRTQVRFLCLECHPSTPASHDLSSSQYQNCTVCHSRVHGSNLSRKLFE